jgi:uncharacterized membrane protein
MTMIVAGALLCPGCDSDGLTEPTFHTVTGFVTHSDNGGGIPKVDVRIGERSFRTGSNGYYELKGVRPGERVITARKDCCYVPAEDTIMVEGDLRHDFQLEPVFSPN